MMAPIIMKKKRERSGGDDEEEKAAITWNKLQAGIVGMN